MVQYINLDYINLLLIIIIGIIIILNSIKLYSNFNNTNLEKFSNTSQNNEYKYGISEWTDKIMTSDNFGDIILDDSEIVKKYIDDNNQNLKKYFSEKHYVQKRVYENMQNSFETEINNNLGAVGAEISNLKLKNAGKAWSGGPGIPPRTRANIGTYLWPNLHEYEPIYYVDFTSPLGGGGADGVVGFDPEEVTALQEVPWFPSQGNSWWGSGNSIFSPGRWAEISGPISIPQP